VLRIESLGATRDRARLEDFVWRGDGSDRGIWHHASGEQWEVVTTFAEAQGRGRRSVVQRTLRSDPPRIIDRLVFTFEPDRFTEQDASGRLRVELPAELRLGRRTGPGVTLSWAGPVRLQLDESTVELDAIALDFASTRQWLGRGVGELWIGTVGGEPSRWLAQWTGGRRQLFEGAG